MLKPTSYLDGLLRVQDRISLAGQWLGALALGSVVIIYAFEIVMRYFLRAPTIWASDFVSFLLLVSVFAALPWLTREGGNVAVTLLPDFLPPALGQRLLRAGFFVSAMTCLWVAYIGLEETLISYGRNTMTMTTVRVPRWPMLLLIAVAFLGSGLHFFRLALARDVENDGSGHV